MVKRFSLTILSVLGFASAAFGQIDGGVFPGPVDSAAVISALGYTPVNKAGDTMLGDLKFTDASFDIGKSGATRPRDGFFSRNFQIGTSLAIGGATVGTNALAVTGTSLLTGLSNITGAANAGEVVIGGTGATTGVSLSNSGTNTLTLLRGDKSSGAVLVVGSLVSPGVASASRSQIGLNGVDGNAVLQNAAGTGFGLLQLGGTTSSFPAWKRSSATLAARLADDSADAQSTAKSVLGVTLTVATLPTASSNQGALAFVSDATLTAITGLGLAVTGGGSNKVTVYSDGSNWIIL